MAFPDEPLEPRSPDPNDGSSKIERDEPSAAATESVLPVADQGHTIISKRQPRGGDHHPLEPNLSPDSGRHQVGDRVGIYELLEYVGGGGMGRVFRAKDTQLGRHVALKLLPQDQATNAETLERFRGEARLTARLDHENITRVYFVGEEKGVPFIAFEFVEGTTIRRLVDQHGPLPLADAVSFTMQMVHALAHAAERGIVHRDVKPSNIMITEEGRVKLIDLGLARLEEIKEADSDLTASGVTLGTFDYISPEQARDPRLVDIRSDIYSLGCTFFYMLTGRPPFPEGTVLQKLLQHQGDEPPELSDFRPDLPEDVSTILRKMLAKDPNRRYQKPAELIDHLELLAGHLGLYPKGPTRSFITSMSRRRRKAFLQRHLPWMAPVAILLGAVLGMNQFWSSEPPQSETASLPGPAFHLNNGSPGGSSDGSPSSTETASENHGLAFPADSIADGNEASPSKEEKGTRDPASASRKPLAGDNSTTTSTPNSARSTPGLLTVGQTTGAPGEFSTLAAACQAAEEGAIIELCFDGPMVERPLALQGAKKLILRGGEGFNPVVVFRPDSPDPVQCPREMITLGGSQLTLLNVAIELDIPQSLTADQWTLFELRRGEAVTMQQSSLTVRNPIHQEVVCFRIVPTWTVDPLETTPAEGEPARVTLTDCVVRGKTTFFQAESMQPAQVSWQNGLFVSSKPFLVTTGGDRRPMPGEEISVQLSHMTLNAEGGLARLGTGLKARYLLPVSIDCFDSIVLIPPEEPMIRQVIDPKKNQWQTVLDWSGDRNFYSGFQVFWKPEPSSLYDNPPILFYDWRALWMPKNENYSYYGQIAFHGLPSSTVPLEAHRTADYLLEDDPENPALNAAGDRGSVGCHPDQLPQFSKPKTP